MIECVLYDACMLFPAPLRDLLVSLAAARLLRARWSAAIHAEWMGNLLRARPDLSRAALERTRRLMDTAVPDCLVTGYEPLVGTLGLPDPDDEHVLAAAITGGATVIVTFNRKDFPAAALAAHGITTRHPDDLAAGLFQRSPDAVLTCLHKQRGRLVSPPQSAVQFLATLRQQGLPQTADRLMPYAARL